MVAVDMPGRRSGGPPATLVPDHHPHDALPGLIQLVSAMAHGGLRLRMMLDSTSRPGWSPIMRTRQGELCGSRPLTASAGSSSLGERCIDRVVFPFWVELLTTNMPAYWSRSASVIAIQPTP